MEIRTRDENDIKVMILKGEMDTVSSPKVEAFLNELRARGADNVLLNFELLDFISSAGLRVLLSTALRD